VAVASAEPYANLQLAQTDNHASIPPLCKSDDNCKIIKTIHQQLKSMCLAATLVGWIEDLFICLRKLGSQERELMCHMESHKVTCHPAEVTFPPLLHPIKAGTRFSEPEECKAQLT